jgi:hypothetical protein
MSLAIEVTGDWKFSWCTAGPPVMSLTANEEPDIKSPVAIKSEESRRFACFIRSSKA